MHTIVAKRRKTLETFHGLLIIKKVATGFVIQVYCLAMQNFVISKLFFDARIQTPVLNCSVSKQSLKEQ